MIKKFNFNYNNANKNLSKNEKEIEANKQNKIFLNNMLKRMNEKKYI